MRPTVYSRRRKRGILTLYGYVVSVDITVDDRIKQLLRDLGTAINESISGSDDVNRQIQRIRDEGYDLYVVLDATIGLNKQGDSEETTEVAVSDRKPKEVQF